MLLITKRLAEAVVAHYQSYDSYGNRTCDHCKAENYEDTYSDNVSHTDDCVVVAAKLLLEKEWGIKDGA